MSTPHPSSPSRSIRRDPRSIDIDLDLDPDTIRPTTPKMDGRFVIHDPNSPCMIARPSTPSRKTIAVKPSLGELHSSPSGATDNNQPGSPPFDQDHTHDHNHNDRTEYPYGQHGRQTSTGSYSLKKPNHSFYDGTKSVTSSTTAFDSGMLHGTSSESYLIIDPRKDPRLFSQFNKVKGGGKDGSTTGTAGHGYQDAHGAGAGAGGGKRKRVDFNKPLKFWLIFVSLCFSCLLSALDLVSPLIRRPSSYFLSFLGASLHVLTSILSVCSWYDRPPSPPPSLISSTISRVKIISGWDRRTR
jgi:hypothetical protein